VSRSSNQDGGLPSLRIHFALDRKVNPLATRTIETQRRFEQQQS
jgi:hypothetical protein